MTPLMKVTRIAYKRDPEPGKPGERGAMARPRKYKAGIQYLSGASGEVFIDYAYYNGVFYRCMSTHLAAESETPFSEVQKDSGLWQVENDMDFLSVRCLIVGEDGSGWILENGQIRHTSGKITLDSDGSANFNDKTIISKDGIITAVEGLFQGKVSIADGKILLDTDGSGHLADGAISWDADGDGEISGAWLNPIGETTSALNRTVLIGSSITSGRSVSVGSYNSANVSSSSPVKRLGSVTIISTNTTSPSYIYISGAKIAMPRIVESSKRVSSLMSLYSYLILAPGSSVTFDVYDEYSNSARVLRSKSPVGWFNFRGSIYPCTYEGARYEDLAAIAVTNNAIGSSLTGGEAKTVINLPDGLVKFMKLKVGGDLATTTEGDNSICFQRTDGSGTTTTSYSITKLKTETDIVSSGYTDYRDGGKFGFGHYYGATTYTTSNSPTLYVKLYDAGSMIAYFEITL